MITRKRSRAFAIAGVLLFILLISFQSFRSQDPFNRILSEPIDAELEELCVEGAGVTSCDSRQTAAADLASESVKAAATALALSRPGPAKIVYPAGYEKFSLKDPLQEDATTATADPDALTEASDMTILGVTEALEAWIPYVAQKDINRVIFQTWHADPGPLSIPFASWRDKHRAQNSYSRYFMNAAETLQLMLRLARDLPLLKDTYDQLPSRMLKLDYLRYAALFKDGGVYADFDTNCYQPIESWLKLCSDGNEAHAPGFIVGVDMDLDGDMNFDEVHGHKLLLADYVWVARRGHPILRDLLADIIVLTPEFRRSLDFQKVSDVRAWTGRGRFTEAVIRHVQRTVKGFSAETLQGLHTPKMFADVCVLPIAAFGSGQRRFSNSPESAQANPDVLVKHYFMESWIERKS